MKLTNNLLNNQNYVIANKKRDGLLKFYYSIYKPHQADTLWMAAFSMSVIIVMLLLVNIWIWKTYGEFYFIFTLPISFFGTFYLTFKLWSWIRYRYLKNRYVVIFNTFLDKPSLEKIYATSHPHKFVQKYFYKISVKYLKNMDKIIKHNNIYYKK